nr:reverse transcriptase domain-containing protein [Tanacetum cinerariifolium]
KDEVDEAKKEVESASSKQAKFDPPPIKAYKPKIPYPQPLRKENMEERYAKFIDIFKEVRINVPHVDVLASMPNYEKFMKDLVSNKSKMEQIYSAFLNEECSAFVQNKLPPKLGDPVIFLIPYFVIQQVEEDDKVLLILGRPFFHTADVIIRVKNKELNLGVGDDKITFLIEKSMQDSHSNDDICFHMDVIDEVTEEEMDALLDDSEPYLSTSEKINESSLDKEVRNPWQSMSKKSLNKRKMSRIISRNYLLRKI